MKLYLLWDMEGCSGLFRKEQAWYWDEKRSDWFPVEPSLPMGRCYTQGATVRDGLVLLGGRKSTPEGRMSLRDAWWLRRHDGRFSWTQLPEMNYPRAITYVRSAAHALSRFVEQVYE